MSHVQQEEMMVLHYIVFSPEKWTIRDLAMEMEMPWTTMKNRVQHLRASGFVHKNKKLRATNDGLTVFALYQQKVRL